MRREKNLFADTCEASCLAAASLCAEESAAYVRDVYRLPGTYLRAGIELARSATSWQLAVASYLAFVVLWTRAEWSACNKNLCNGGEPAEVVAAVA